MKSHAELEELVKERVQTVYHPTSTCVMAPEAEGGVVDARLRVYGVKGLRVCDASFFPRIVSGHPVRSTLIRLGCGLTRNPGGRLLCCRGEAVG